MYDFKNIYGKIYIIINTYSEKFKSAVGNRVTLKLFTYNYAFDIYGSINNINELNRFPGLAFTEIKIEYSPFLLDLIIKKLNIIV